MTEGNLTCSQSIDFEVQDARRIIEDEEGEVRNHFVIVTGGEMIYVAALWRDGKERHLIIEGVRKLLQIKQADYYIHASEAWMGSREDILPSKDPERREIFMVIGVERVSRKKHHRIYPIFRDEEGKRRLGETPIMEDESSYSGSSFNLFDPDPRVN
jgi:hypothetical protein